jgi:hypothetical protein
MAMILCSGVMALAGLVGLKSQGYHRGHHPTVGGVVHLSLRSISGQWAAVLATTARQCYLVYIAWRMDGV